jgi:hypothetical protein
MSRWTPAEHAIDAAMQAVEALPADVRLTDAVVLLGAARECVADYTDGVSKRHSIFEAQERIKAMEAERNGVRRAALEEAARIAETNYWAPTRGGVCIECGEWTPARHSERHDHAEGCSQESLERSGSPRAAAAIRAAKGWR